MSYLITLELDFTKLSHYVGFLYGNEMLSYTERGYVPNEELTHRYQRFIAEWFGTDRDITINGILQVIT